MRWDKDGCDPRSSGDEKPVSPVADQEEIDTGV